MLKFISTPKTFYYDISKVLWNLLNSLTENDYVVQDSFFSVKKVSGIPKESFEDGFRLISFEIESLFTSVLLSRASNIIVERIHNQELLTGNIKKRTASE